MRETSYESRKPKWWTKLAGRRGTRAQRSAIQRMTLAGYCLDKVALKDFSSRNNQFKYSNNDGNSSCGSALNSVINSSCHTKNNCDNAPRISTADDNNGETNSHKEFFNSNAEQAESRRVRNWWNAVLAVSENNCHDKDNCILDHHAKNTESCSHETAEPSVRSPLESSLPTSPLAPRTYEKIFLEIGFGSGDNLLTNARCHPDNLYLGSEIHQPGIGNVLQLMEQTNCDQTMNVRIIPGDGIKLLNHLPNDYLDGIFITFPDPWPRECHSRWRVVQLDSLRQMYRVVKKAHYFKSNFDINKDGPRDAGRVYVATDAECFDSWTRSVFRQFSLLSSTIRPKADKIQAHSATGVLSEKNGDQSQQAEVNDAPNEAIVKNVRTKTLNCNENSQKVHNAPSCQQGPYDNLLITAQSSAQSNQLPLSYSENCENPKSSMKWKELTPCPNREEWLPIISHYEQKGLNEGRVTMLQCWEAL